MMMEMMMVEMMMMMMMMVDRKVLDGVDVEMVMLIAGVRCWFPLFLGKKYLSSSPSAKTNERDEVANDLITRRFIAGLIGLARSL